MGGVSPEGIPTANYLHQCKPSNALKRFVCHVSLAHIITAEEDSKQLDGYSLGPEIPDKAKPAAPPRRLGEGSASPWIASRPAEAATTATQAGILRPARRCQTASLYHRDWTGDTNCS